MPFLLLLEKVAGGREKWSTAIKMLEEYEKKNTWVGKSKSTVVYNK